MAACILLLVFGFLHFAHGLFEYVVYPTDKRDVSACSRINDALVKMLGNSKVRIYKSQPRQTTEFWLVEALSSQQGMLSGLPGVRNLLTKFCTFIITFF